MANMEHLAELKKGVVNWNDWRKSNPDITPDLTHANLHSMHLGYANLNNADLSYADLSYVNLEHAGLRQANMTNANLTRANLTRTHLSDARLTGATGITPYMLRVADLLSPQTLTLPDGTECHDLKSVTEANLIPRPEFLCDPTPMEWSAEQAGEARNNLDTAAKTTAKDKNRHASQLTEQTASAPQVVKPETFTLEVSQGGKQHETNIPESAKDAKPFSKVDPTYIKPISIDAGFGKTS